MFSPIFPDDILQYDSMHGMAAEVPGLLSALERCQAAKRTIPQVYLTQGCVHFSLQCIFEVFPEQLVLLIKVSPLKEKEIRYFQLL